MSYCDQCRANLGYVDVVSNGVHRMAECECRSQETEVRSQKAGGFQSAGEILAHNKALEAVLIGEDRKIAAIIESRKGQQNAVTIREIVLSLWPDDLKDARFFNMRARQVKKCVERMRRFGRVPIAASKTAPAGYFIPSTAEEMKEMYWRHVQEGCAHFGLAKLFDPDADVVRDAEGQLQLEAR